MTTFRRGDVILVPFDFTDGSGRKLRPAVVVSDNRHNDETPDLIIASITSNLRALRHPGDHAISRWQAAGLLRASLAQAKLATVGASVVRRKLGALDSADLAALEAASKKPSDLIS